MQLNIVDYNVYILILFLEKPFHYSCEVVKIFVIAWPILNDSLLSNKLLDFVLPAFYDVLLASLFENKYT